MRLTLLLIGSVSLFAFVGWGRRTVEQPIQFNHKVHLSQFDLDCTFCHRGAKRSARATIPNIRACRLCHREGQPVSAPIGEPDKIDPEEKKLMSYLSEGKTIPWVKVYRVNPHTYFSHVRHTVLAKLECEVCHGEIREKTTPVDRQAIKISMANCIECHEQHRVDNDCMLCHR